MRESKRILIICPFPKGVAAGQRLKYEQYLNLWKKKGWEVDISSFMDISTWEVAYLSGNYAKKIFGVVKGHCRRLFDLFRIRNYDLVYVFMYVTPFFSTIMERLVKKLARNLIYDIEDNILTEQKFSKINNPNPFSRILKSPNKANFLIRNADHVITSSPFLNQFCLEKNINKACTYVTSSINTKLFFPTNKYLNNKILTIGWTGTFSSKGFLDQLEGVFLKLSKRVEFKVRIIGNFEYDLQGINLEVIKWSKKREVKDMQGIDIGIYPLPNDNWVLGKSGLKAIQYMAFGIPCVASNVGTTPLIIKDRVNGLLVKSEEEWVDALEELIQDPLLRKRLGSQARKDAIENYSLDAVSKQYNQILTSVLEK